LSFETATSLIGLEGFGAFVAAALIRAVTVLRFARRAEVRAGVAVAIAI
jgi:hypothetical protein